MMHAPLLAEMASGRCSWSGALLRDVQLLIRFWAFLNASHRDQETTAWLYLSETDSSTAAAGFHYWTKTKGSILFVRVPLQGCRGNQPTAVKSEENTVSDDMLNIQSEIIQSKCSDKKCRLNWETELISVLLPYKAKKGSNFYGAKEHRSCVCENCFFLVSWGQQANTIS